MFCLETISCQTSLMCRSSDLKLLVLMLAAEYWWRFRGQQDCANKQCRSQTIMLTLPMLVQVASYIFKCVIVGLGWQLLNNTQGCANNDWGWTWLCIRGYHLIHKRSNWCIVFMITIWKISISYSVVFVMILYAPQTSYLSTIVQCIIFYFILWLWNMARIYAVPICTNMFYDYCPLMTSSDILHKTSIKILLDWFSCVLRKWTHKFEKW